MPIRHLSHRNLAQLVMHRLSGTVLDGGQALGVLTRLDPEPSPPDPLTVFHYARLAMVEIDTHERHESSEQDQDIEQSGDCRAVILATTVYPRASSDVFAHEGYLDTITSALCSQYLSQVTESPVTAILDTQAHFMRFTTSAYADEDDGPLTVRTLLTFYGRASAFPV